jgi:hypothetical protein
MTKNIFIFSSPEKKTQKFVRENTNSCVQKSAEENDEKKNLKRVCRDV